MPGDYDVDKIIEELERIELEDKLTNGIQNVVKKNKKNFFKWLFSCFSCSDY